LKAAFEALNREYINANDSFTFYTSVTVPGYDTNNEGVNNYRIKLFGVDAEWIYEPDKVIEHTQSGESKIQILVLDIKLTVTSDYKDILGNIIGNVRYDEYSKVEDILGNRKIYYNLKFKNDSTYTLSDIQLTDSFSLKTVTYTECEYQDEIDDDPIPAAYLPSHDTFSLLAGKEKELNYSVLLSPCEVGTLTNTITVTCNYERTEINTSKVIAGDKVISEAKEEVTITLSISDFIVNNEHVTELAIVTTVPEVDTTNHWASEEILKEISGFENIYHLDKTKIDSILREADRYVRDGIDGIPGLGISHKKEKLHGCIDGENTNFCIKEGILISGFTFNPNGATYDDIKVYKKLKCVSSTCSEVCGCYIPVCVRCIDECGNLVLDEAVTDDYELFADFYTYGGFMLDYKTLSIIASKFAAYLISRKIIDEKDNEKYRVGNPGVSFKSDAKSMMRSNVLTTTKVTSFDKSLEIVYT